MTRRCAVVITYPAHFYQTELTLRSIRTHLPTIDRLIVLVDNGRQLSWPNYASLCWQVYQPYSVNMISAASLLVSKKFYRYPWIRQQMIKLYLDQIIDCAEWILIDGDVNLLQAPPESVRFGSRLQYQGRPLDQGDPVPGEKTSQTIFYVRHVLQDQYLGFRDHEGTYITASHPPVHDMSAKVLQSLRQHVEQLHGIDFMDLHLAIAQDTRFSMSEWELIEWYQQHYLAQVGPWYFDQSWYETTWDSDQELGIDWFRARGLEVDPDIWSQLPLAKYS